MKKTRIEIDPEFGMILWDVPSDEVIEQYKADIEEVRRQIAEQEAMAETAPSILFSDF